MEILIAVRTRSDGEWRSSRHRANLEIGGEVSNSITSVQKDNMILEIWCIS